jgi:DNA (cytosine-5)-methyltransferase 1
MKYISICSGIEAASTAWHGLGWTPLAFSEIEPFPSAVLTQRYPSVPNLGDMSKYREWPEELLAECDLLVGGTPCQAFSVAGLRKSLDDERGNLSLIYVHLFHHINEVRKRHGRPPAIALWENVPGVLSTKDNAFGCFISGLLGVDDTIETQDGKWPKAGFLGSETVRVGYRVLDAQYFAVAQRRRRVFLVAVPCELVASLGERACPSEILSLRESVLGNPPTRGEARQAVAGGSAERPASSGEPYHLDRAMFNQGVNAQYEPQITDDGVAASMVARGPAAVMWNASDQANAERLVDHAGTLNCNKGQRGGWIAPSGHPDPAYALSAGNQSKGGVFGSGRDSQDTFVVGEAVAFKPSHYTRGKDEKPDEVVPPLSADADKGDQDTLVLRQSLGFNWQNGGGYGDANDGLGITEEGTGPLSRPQVPACVTGPRTHALTTRAAAVEEDGTGRGTPIIPAVFTKAKRAQMQVQWASGGGKVENPTMQALRTSAEHSYQFVRHAMQVRRLTPTECCRLQGFPDEHCDITFRKKPAADGPKYRALGNSMAVPCMAWLGYRIQKATQAE